MNLIHRSCTELPAQEERRLNPPKPQRLSSFRDRPAYVLLGDPGEGKTTSLEDECEALGDKGHWVTARHFLALSAKPEWREKTLFIDGLDEVRAGRADARTPFDDIRGRLDDLGSPPFRLSCRMADWLGANDRQNLNAVSPDGAVSVLRLEPLTDRDVIEILKSHPNVGDAQAFLDRAKAGGIEPLLRNPHSLKMLATTFANQGQMPDGLLDTLEVACQQLVLEHNEEHNAITTNAQPHQMLETAGHFCALQLITGSAGYAIRPEAATEDYPDLREVEQSPDNIGRKVLASKLFSSPVEGRTEPSHRRIAEYLGGRYLAERIDNGLPASRIIALMTGLDGMVVTPLRGLSAWTAAHSPTARLDLTDRDPIGVGLYGDVRAFSLDEKRGLLRALQRNPITVRSPYEAARAFGPLASPGMEETFREILTSTNPGDDVQRFKLFVLLVAAEGNPLPELADLLMQLARDATSGHGVNSAALRAFLHCSPTPKRESRLVTLLEDIRSGHVRDDRNELLGFLLIALYPTAVGPRSVWDYLVDNPDNSWFGSYSNFWSYKLLEQSSDEQVPELLDELTRRNLARRQLLEPHYLQDLPAQLLVRGLATHGDQLSANRLYGWLGLNVEDGALISCYDASLARKAGDWLRKHPDRFKDVLIEGMRQAPETDELGSHVQDMEARLHNAPSPPDIGHWCLEQALGLDGAKPRSAQCLLNWAVRAHWRGEDNDELSEALLRKRVGGSPNLKAHLELLLAPSDKSDWQDRRQMREAKQQKQREEWIEAIRSHHNALIDNRAPPGILHQLALAYLGNSYRPKEPDGPACIREMLSGDNDLTRAALNALRGVVDRDDVPMPDQVLQLYRDDKLHFLNLPFLVCLAERERLGNDNVGTWTEERVQTALVMRHCALWGDHDPKWYLQLVELRPAEVAAAIVQIGVSELKRGKAAGGLFWPLARDPAYSEVAKRSCLPLLRAFPTRCRVDQLGTLDDLLWAAIRQADRNALHELAKQKLSRKSMNSSQRIHWLAAARTAFGDAFQSELEASVDTPKHQNGVAQLVVFFSCNAATTPSLDEFDIGGIETLIRLFAGFSGPEDEFFDGIVTTVGEASALVGKLTAELSASPRKQAGDALARLAANPDLSRWQRPLRRAIEGQRTIRRDTEFRHPTINQVNETLKEGLPANAADLAALVMDRLRDIATNIRHSNTNDWHQYWNVDPYDRPEKPKPEPACRDALLSDLRQRLPTGIQAEPEGIRTNDSKADIVVAHNDLQVPVEAKKNQHRELWSALKDQLIGKYAPVGPGIYLVFWFGPIDTPPPPIGGKPKNPTELKERLEAQLSSEERRRIHIVVIDVGRPPQAEA